MNVYAYKCTTTHGIQIPNGISRRSEQALPLILDHTTLSTSHRRRMRMFLGFRKKINRRQLHMRLRRVLEQRAVRFQQFVKLVCGGLVRRDRGRRCKTEQGNQGMSGGRGGTRGSAYQRRAAERAW